MRWHTQTGQAAVEAAALMALVAVLLAGVFTAGYAAVAQLLVVSSAGQGAHRGALACIEGQAPEAVLATAEQSARDVLSPLHGPKEATAVLDGQDLVVTASYLFTPPLPGAQVLVGENVRFQATARERCS